MTQPLSPDPVETVKDEGELLPPRKPSRLPLLAALLVIALALGVLGQAVLPSVQEGEPLVAAQPAGDRVAQLEARLKRAEEKLAKIEGTAVEPSAAVQGPDAGDLEKLKNGLAGLGNALALLQAQLEKSAENTNEVRQNAETGLALALAFVQMQNAALSGGLFEKERQTLRQMAGEDQVLADALIRLEPVALTGAPALSQLRQQWKDQSGQAQAALRKAAAKTWQERILVALEGLVSIRSLAPAAGQQSLSFAEIERDLGKGDLAAAMEKVAALPLEVQTELKDWREKATLRRTMEEALEQIAHHLIDRGQKAQASAPAPSAQEPVSEGASP